MVCCLGDRFWHGWGGRRTARRIEKLRERKVDNGRETKVEEGGEGGRRRKSWRLVKMFTLGLEEASPARVRL